MKDWEETRLIGVGVEVIQVERTYLPQSIVFQFFVQFIFLRLRLRIMMRKISTFKINLIVIVE